MSPTSSPRCDGSPRAAPRSTRSSSRHSSPGAATTTRSSALTPREREVLVLMAEGRSNQGIADKLVITLRAVEKYVSTIFGKLGLPSARQRLTPCARRAALPALLTRGAPTPDTRNPSPRHTGFPPSRRLTRLRRSFLHSPLEGTAMKSRVIQDDSDERPTDGQVAADHGNGSPRSSRHRGHRTARHAGRVGPAISRASTARTRPPSTPCGASRSTLRAARSPR